LGYLPEKKEEEEKGNRSEMIDETTDLLLHEPLPTMG